MSLRSKNGANEEKQAVNDSEGAAKLVLALWCVFPPAEDLHREFSDEPASHVARPVNDRCRVIYEGLEQLQISRHEDSSVLFYIEEEKKTNFPHTEGLSVSFEIEKLHQNYVPLPIYALPVINPEKYSALSRMLVQ